jgi:hypothetical protein
MVSSKPERPTVAIEGARGILRVESIGQAGLWRRHGKGGVRRTPAAVSPDADRGFP